MDDYWQSNTCEAEIRDASSDVLSTSLDVLMTQYPFNQQTFWENEISQLCNPPTQNEPLPTLAKPTINDYDLDFILQGKGFYGKFCEVKCKINNESHVVKIVEKDDFFNVWRFNEMVKILKKLKFANFSTTMVNHFETPRYLMLATKKIPGRNLEHLCSDRLFLIRTLCNCAESLYPDNVIIEFLRQLFQGLNFLNSYGIVHCNIQPKHIIIDESGDIKLCDFFYSQLSENGNLEKMKLNFKMNTNYFASPEILQEGLIDYKTDLWSLGLTIIYMVYGLVPMNAFGNPTFDVNRPQSELTNALFKCKFLFERLHVNNDITLIVDNLLKLDPDSRCNTAVHLNNPIFENRMDINKFLFEINIG